MPDSKKKAIGTFFILTIPFLLWAIPAMGKDSELNEIKEIKQEGDKKISLSILVRPLSEDENTFLISDYEESAKNIESIRNKGSKFRSMTRTEIHQWVKAKDGWKKSYTNTGLLNK